MQTVDAAFTAEAQSNTRTVKQNTQISWNKFSTLGNVTFTIGVSLIGGNDAIGANPGAIVGPGTYKYFDDTAYVMGMDWEHQLAQPIGGVNMSMASVTLDNTSGRYLPDYMGGNSELFTAILPDRPMILSAGFKVGTDITLPQFSGVTNKFPQISVQNKSIKLQAADYMQYFSNKKMDKTTMWTGQRSDVIIEDLLSNQLGMNTAQYRLDEGINIIPFAYFETGTKFTDAIEEIVQAENAQFYQDEEGIFRFENRQHWNNAPHNTVQKIIMTSQVIEAETNITDHLINVVEVTANPRVKQSSVTIFELSGYIKIDTETIEQFITFDNPVLASESLVFEAYANSDGTGADLSANISFKVDLFATSAKLTITNSGIQTAYITVLTMTGRWAVERYDTPLYIRTQDSSSLTAYQEKTYSIRNDFIQDETWATSYGQMILTDYSEPEKLQQLTIRALPQLQRGDLISWQGRYWRIYGIRSRLDANSGFVQELSIVQRTLVTYFQIGVSTIGGSDQIAP